MLLRIRSAVGLFVILALLLTSIPTRVASADTVPLTRDEANSLLQAYGIVLGDPDGNLRLNDQLTRAEAAAIFVRTLGMGARAESLASSVPFTDVQGHWAAGVIAAADQFGLMHGDGDGTFRPNDNITNAEVFTVLLRMVNHEPPGPWNPTTILFTAQQYGLVSAPLQAQQPAIRGQIFWSLATTITRILLPSGKTVLQTYIDSVAPQIILDQTNLVTTSETVTIAGVASETVQVTVNGKPATYTKENRRFSYTANLSIGTNTFTVAAVDLASNSSTTVFSARRDPIVSRLQISGDTRILVNTSVLLTVTAFDNRGLPVPAGAITAELAGNVASFDVASGRLTTGSSAGHGVLTLHAGNATATFNFDVIGPSPRATQLTILPINAGRPPAIGKEVNVTVQVADTNGVAVSDDNGRMISLSAGGLPGVTITPSTKATQAGIATFTIKSATVGDATISATTSGLTPAHTALSFLTNQRIVLTVSPSTLVPDGISQATIRATLQDENGATVRNTSGSSIDMILRTSGGSDQLVDNQVSIPDNATNSSGNDGLFRASIYPGTFTITADTIGYRGYSIQPALLSLTGQLPGTTLQVYAPSNRQSPGSTLPISVRVLDNYGQLVQSGSYAFQLLVTTSNNERVTNGLPEGTSLTFANSALSPIGGIAGRTYQGSANLNLTYDKSGVVTITPVLIGPVESAYHNSAGYGPAVGSSRLIPQQARITFAGTPARLQLTADSALGRDQPGGAVKSSANMTIRAKVVDTDGTPVVGYGDNITLTRTSGKGVTHIIGVTGNSITRSASNGVAEFTIQGSNTAGYDLYTASAGGLSSTQIEIAVRSDVAAAPAIAAVRGVKEGDPSPITGYVAADANYMDIQLRRQDPPISGEPNYWVTAKVYRMGEPSPLFTSGALDLRSGLPVVRVPKSALRTGNFAYEVTIDNGAGDSPRPIDPDLNLISAINATYNNSYVLQGALLDAEHGKLLLSASGLSSDGILTPSKLAIVKGDYSLPLNGNVAVGAIDPSGVLLDLGALVDGIDPDRFNGTVILKAEDNWFTSANREQVAKASQIAMIKPMAHLTAATLDVAGRMLFLQGAGLSQGMLSLDLISILREGQTEVALNPGDTADHDRLISVTDTQVTIALSQATLNAINALQGPEVYVTAQMGWLKVTKDNTTYSAIPVHGTHCQLLVRATLTSAGYDRSTNTLTLGGTGLAGATVSPGHLVFRASGTTTDWRPSHTVSVVAASDTTVDIKFSDEDATQFESNFSGRSLFLNTAAGWLTDGVGRQAPPISQDNVLFFVPAN